MADTWKKSFLDEGLPDELVTKIVGTYTNAEVFCSCFRHESDLEKYGKSLLVDSELASADDWSFHPHMGALRRVLQKNQQPKTSPDVPHAAPSQALCPLFPSLLTLGGQRLSEGEKDLMVVEFGKNYPGVVLYPDVKPSLGYLQLINSQCASKMYAWTPWKKILSEEASLDVSSRRAGARKRDMADIIAHAAGIYDEEWDLELYNAPLKIQQLLSVRAHAYSLCKHGHLHSWMSYAHRFVHLYSAKPGQGLRPLTSEEAEVADKELMGEIFRMVQHDAVSLDDALVSVVREDLLRHKLSALPRGRKFQEPPGKKLEKPALKRRKMEGDGKVCFAWQKSGKCRFGKDCKFPHDGNSKEWLSSDASNSSETLRPAEHSDLSSIRDGDCVVGASVVPRVPVQQWSVPPQLMATVPIEDGGGLGSSADWLVPRCQVDFFKPLRSSFRELVAAWHLCGRLQTHLAARNDFPVFSAHELDVARQEMANFLKKAGFPCSLAVREHQPFLLDMWHSLTQATRDIDVDLPQTLISGVPTGILSPIPPSGVWEVNCVDDNTWDCSELVVHHHPWQSALEDVELTKSLLMQDVKAGFAYILEGGEAAARAKWGPHVAAGKLGVVVAPPRKPRLIGDASVSGANAACRISEKVRLPRLSGVQQFLSLESAAGLSWVAFSFDVASAHKQVLIREEEQGLASFVLDGVWYTYRSCYFGAKFSAFWWARTGAWLVRMLHRWIFIKHGLWLYVDDGFILLPKNVAPLIATEILLFLGALGVPLSWRKLSLAPELVWIGWRFSLTLCHAELPEDKKTRLLQLLGPFCRKGAKVERAKLEQLVGILVWFCGGASWLRPWFQAFYHILCKPRAVFRTIDMNRFAALRDSLSDSLVLLKQIAGFDMRLGWKLHAVGNVAVESLSAQPLSTPRSKHGQVALTFYEYGAKHATMSSHAAFTARLFHNAVAANMCVPLILRSKQESWASADAWAERDRAGIGGWWTSCAPSSKADVFWFSMQFSKADLPDWFKSESSVSLQSCIAALEALAQLVLMVLRWEQDGVVASQCSIQLRQLCDNQSVVAATAKMLSQKAPLCYVLQALGFWACKFGCVLETSHIDGVRNIWADELSRDKLDGFAPSLQMHPNLVQLLDLPWSQ